jgi:hypothetical protein
MPNLFQFARVLLLLLAFGTACGATSLTGVTLFDTDPEGNAGSLLWNTLGGDASPNLYLIEPPINNAYNTGNAAGARVNVPLFAGVNYVFLYWAQPAAGGGGSRFGVNLFFNGDDLTPRISATVLLSGSTSAVNSSTATRSLTGAIVPAAGRTTFVDGGLAVTLQGFSDFASLTDTVQAFDNTSGGGPDFTGFITLSVASIPEPRPATLLYLGMALFAAGARLAESRRGLTK